MKKTLHVWNPGLGNFKQNWNIKNIHGCLGYNAALQFRKPAGSFSVSWKLGWAPPRSCDFCYFIRLLAPPGQMLWLICSYYPGPEKQATNNIRLIFLIFLLCMLWIIYSCLGLYINVKFIKTVKKTLDFLKPIYKYSCFIYEMNNFYINIRILKKKEYFIIWLMV